MERGSKLILASNGTSRYKIVIGKDASASEKHAADELQHFIKEISGVEIPVTDDSGVVGSHEIIVGGNRHLEQLGVQVNWEKLGNEGFVIRTHEDCLIIAGGKLRGTMYGVYTFLEDYLGCRWFSASVSRIPAEEKIEVEQVEFEYVPVLEYREPFYTDAFDGDWSARNRMNGAFSRLEEKHGGKIAYGDYFVHTFYKLLPPSLYFNEHPEYYAEVDGKRIAEFGEHVTASTGQLCLTNPDVLRIVVSRIKDYLKEHSTVSIISVSQNDSYPNQNNYCHCEKCAEIDRREGSPSGSLIYFVNKVAEEIEKDFPNVAIDTLAYRYSRKPPLTIRPRKNVIVRLCSIECCFSHPIESCKREDVTDINLDQGTFVKDLEGWAKLCDRVYIWDYVTNFAHYIMPMPNLGVLGPNIGYFIRNNVKGIFEEGNYSQGGHGEFAELRAYMLAKLLWNPNRDVNEIIDDFLSGYYGKAAACIKEYITLLIEKVNRENIHVSIYDSPNSAYLSDDLIKTADEIFDRAEALADNEDILKRVKTARLPVMYVRMCRMPKDDPHRIAVIDEFFNEAAKCGVTHISEGGRNIEESRVLMKG